MYIFDYLFIQIGRVDGVILLNWRDSALERQIEYASKLGEIGIDAAMTELDNFRRNVIQVAEYFDYKQMLYVVRGRVSFVLVRLRFKPITVQRPLTTMP